MAKEAAPFDVSSNSGRSELIDLVERIERQEEERAEVGREIAETYAEAKGRGFDAAALRRLVADRKRQRKDPEKKLAQDEMFELYKGCFE